MNIENLLKTTISSSQYRAINILREQFDRLGIRAFLVGGTVRDILLGQPITDIDSSIILHSGHKTWNLQHSHVANSHHISYPIDHVQLLSPKKY